MGRLTEITVNKLLCDSDARSLAEAWTFSTKHDWAITKQRLCTGTGSSANLQASAVCGGSSGQKCVAGIVPADLSFLKPVASAPVPQNLQNSAGSTQPSTSSNSASNVNPLQKGTATSASLPGVLCTLQFETSRTIYRLRYLGMYPSARSDVALTIS